MQKIADFTSKNWLLLIIILQPILDIVAYFNFNTSITLITFISRSIILLFIVLYVLIKLKNKKKYIYLLSPIFIFSICHLLNSLRCGSYSIFSDLRYLVTVMQLPILIVAFTMYLKENNDAKKQITYGLIISFFIIFLSLIISFISGNYNTTYSGINGGYGITGWFTSANTQSMILSILCPLFLYYFTFEKSKIIYWIGNMLAFIVLYTNSTKACFYTMVCMFFVMLYLNIFNHNNKNKIFYIIVSTIIFIGSIVSYNYSFTFIRKVDVNNVIDTNKNTISEIDKKYEEAIKNIEEEADEDIKIEELDRTKYQIILEKLNTSYLYRDLINQHGEKKVVEKMKDKISPSTLSDNRIRKVINAQIIYDESDFVTKLVGFDFSRISRYSMDMENDLTAIFYYYGYIGFTIYISYFLYFIYIAIRKIVINPKMIFNGEFIILCFVFALAVGGGQYSGAFLRKPNANVYLALSLALLYVVCINKNIGSRKSNLKKKKKIKFLLLHLGYGGIETSTINTANALGGKYDVELVSLYNLKENQEYKINKNIIVKHLYDGEPNRLAFNNALANKKIINILCEGLKAIKILILKKSLIIKEIRCNDSDVIISTRMEFSILLSKYGFADTLKIAQEHTYHNNEKKYINTIKYKYANIDYLLALTNGLANDYKEFLINNDHTKVVVMPNMLIDYPKKLSKLDKKNIIYVGRLHSEKRVNELINIFSKIDNKNSKFYIVGDGKELQNLECIIKKLKLKTKVKLLGYLNNNDIEKHMLDSSVFVMASISEGLPMVLLEAMSYGLPCIAYETNSGINDIIDDNINGYIIKDRNKEEFINKLQLLLFDFNKKNNMQKRVLLKSKEFSKKNILKIWLKILG